MVAQKKCLCVFDVEGTLIADNDAKEACQGAHHALEFCDPCDKIMVTDRPSSCVDDVKLSFPTIAQSFFDNDWLRTDFADPSSAPGYCGSTPYVRREECEDGQHFDPHSRSVARSLSLRGLVSQSSYNNVYVYDDKAENNAALYTCGGGQQCEASSQPEVAGVNEYRCPGSGCGVEQQPELRGVELHTLTVNCAQPHTYQFGAE